MMKKAFQWAVSSIPALAVLAVIPLTAMAACNGEKPVPDGEIKYHTGWYTEVDAGTGITLRCQINGHGSANRYNKTCYVWKDAP